MTGMQFSKPWQRMSNYPCSLREFCQPLMLTLYQKIDRQRGNLTITMTAAAPQNSRCISNMIPPNPARSQAQPLLSEIKSHNPSQITWAALFTRQESLGDNNLNLMLLILSLTLLQEKKIRRTGNRRESKSYKKTTKNLPLNLHRWGQIALSVRKMTSQMMIDTGASENKNL